MRCYAGVQRVQPRSSFSRKALLVVECVVHLRDFPGTILFTQKHKVELLAVFDRSKGYRYKRDIIEYDRRTRCDARSPILLIVVLDFRKIIVPIGQAVVMIFVSQPGNRVL